MKRVTEDSLEELGLARSVVIEQILAIQDANDDDAVVCELAYDLQDRFNQISDRISNSDYLGAPPLRDPLEVFPPEIWTKIILDVPLERIPASLLILTSVSLSWFQKLTGNPVLWSTVVVDLSKADGAAIASTYLNLSGSCQISVTTGWWYPSTSAIFEVVSLLLPHRERIISLTASGLHDTQLLEELGHPPNLQNLEIGASGRIDLDRMPALKQIRIPSPKVGASYAPFISELSIQKAVVSDAECRTWRHAARLQILEVIERRAMDYDAKIVNYLDLPIHELRYRGPNIARALSWTGKTLTSLTISCGGVRDLYNIVAALHETRCDSLALLLDHDLGEKAISPSEPSLREETKVFSAGGVRRLELHFREAWPSTSDELVETDDSWLRSLYEVLALTTRGVERMSVHNSRVTSALVQYLATLDSLDTLDLHSMQGDAVILSSLKGLKKLTKIIWSPSELPAFSILGLHLEASIQFVRNDREWDGSTSFLPVLSYPDVDDGDKPMVTISPDLDGPSSLHSIQVLSFYGEDWNSGIQVNINNILELMVLQPGLFPMLCRLSFPKRGIEWDLLILLLERRNLNTSIGAQPIQIIQYGRPAEHLMTTLADLLGGRYPKRNALSTYSLEAIAERMFNPQWESCLRCCYLLRECDEKEPLPRHERQTLTPDQALVNWIESGRSFPHEVMKPYPALSRRDSIWISGRRQRHNDFLHRYGTVAGISRDDGCLNGSSSLAIDAYGVIMPPYSFHDSS